MKNSEQRVAPDADTTAPRPAGDAPTPDADQNVGQTTPATDAGHATPGTVPGPPPSADPDAPPSADPDAPPSADPGAEPDRDQRAVPQTLWIAAEICWRFLVIVGALAVVTWLVIQLRIVVIPVALALLLAALLVPAVSWLTRHRMPRGLATAAVMVAGIALLVGILSFVIQSFIAGIPQLTLQLEQSYRQFQEFLARPPFNINSPELAALPDQIRAAIAANRDALTSGALTTAATVTELLAGLILALFVLIFFLYDGPRIWRAAVRAFPAGQQRERIRVAGQRAFASLVGYTRATALVAVVDGVFIGLGLFFVGVPLVIPLAALTFLAAFVPTVGAVVSGVVAVLVALVTKGVVSALIVMAIVVAVQQFEGNVMQPLLLGRAVQLHPLAVALAVAAGFVVAGITGALLAVPLLAVATAGMRSLNQSAEEEAAALAARQPGSGRRPPWSSGRGSPRAGLPGRRPPWLLGRGSPRAGLPGRRPPADDDQPT